ncbi:B12-binding domain-containing radical SAM protein [Desulfatitalea alkaliphila]|uniref:B12-binding domain-containing radical SAM protein n=1 Tax=Desulfatitalea alkaliphila TaxID=2929485 RepID=A0AA41R551_9BACT|nr:radical SAM protein [Desulfatitalea alkaliphila]MCJ8501205.1 B12-binding domain-containing radical SAM protein [Desulfatitalea alkaliphila]
MPDILLIQPPIQDFYLTAKRTMPYGLACIAGALRRDGFSVALLDGLASDKSRILPWPSALGYLQPYYGRKDRSPFALFHTYRHFGYSLDHIARQAKASGAALIAISSLFSAYSDMALQTAAAVRRACPQAVIVLGGHHPTALPHSVMDHPAVDYVLRGDGECGLPQLARALRQGAALESVPGLVRRRPGGGVQISPPAVAADLDALPAPAFDLVQWRHYRRHGHGGLAITAGRGCPMRCTYCAVNAATYHGHRRRSVAAVMEEIIAADAITPLGFIDFEDEHLSVDRDWFLALLDVLERRFAGRRIELRAMNGLLASSLDDTLLAAMARAGFKTLNLALITTAAAQLKRFGRPDVTADVDRILKTAPAHGLNAVAYLIAAGPQQDPMDTVRDLLFLARRRVLAGVSIFYPAPGSADYRWCRRHDLLPSQTLQLRSSALPLQHTTTRRQAFTLLRLGRILNFTKQLLDQGVPLPSPAPAPLVVADTGDRLSVGTRLLAAFLHSGTIHGVDADGALYPHRIDEVLADAFREGLMTQPVKGALKH